MIIEILAPALVITIDDWFLSNPKYFCRGCAKHTEECKLANCLRLYQHNTLGNKVFIGFYCPDCYLMDKEEETLKVDVKENRRICTDCGLLPVATPETELCTFCIQNIEETFFL